MADEFEPGTELQTVAAPAGAGMTAAKWILLIAGVGFAAGSSYFLYNQNGRLEQMAKDQSASSAQIGQLTQRIQASEADSEALAKQLGMTKKELSDKSEELQRAQRAAVAKLSQEQQAQSGQISQVSNDVAGVKTDVGGVKTDVASTKADLAATNAKLQSTIGDLGVQSGLIANTREDLEVLKHKGDRNYYEFTLVKGAKPQAISTVMLTLKKTDEKKGKYTLNVTADDKTIEKKDRNVSEPVQFYTGKDHMLYELVIWTVDKKQATGYLSTPKGAPTPVTPGL
ncbi:MAG TPA: hypothetical protein VF753_19325 [Terriglobales bacterium]